MYLNEDLKARFCFETLSLEESSKPNEEMGLVEGFLG